MFPFEIIKHNFRIHTNYHGPKFNAIIYSIIYLKSFKRGEEGKCLTNRKFEKRDPQFHKFHKLQLVPPPTLSRKRSVPKGNTRTLLLTYSKRVFKSLSRCGSTVLDVLVPLFKRSVRKTYLFPPRANVFSLISLFHPLSFLFVRAHDEFSLEISSDCFFFFFFSFLLSPSPSPLRPSSLVVVFFHEMEVRWKHGLCRREN